METAEETQPMRHTGALIAGVILALSAGALSLTVSQNMRSLSLARDYQRAAELLDRTFTKIDLIGPARLLYEGPRQGRFAKPYDRFAWQVKEIEPRLEGNLYEITVRIFWETPGGKPQFIEAQTLLNDPDGSRSESLLWEEL